MIFHVAGAIAALDRTGFDRVNRVGTSNLAAAVAAAGNSRGPRHLVHVSSLAADGPSGSDAPVRDGAVPRPVSAYGRSKLAAEAALEPLRGRVPLTVVRPPSVYGSGDTATLDLFRAVQRHVILAQTGSERRMSFVHAGDLARGLREAAESPPPEWRVLYLTGPEDSSLTGFQREIARAMRVRRRGADSRLVPRAAGAAADIEPVDRSGLHLRSRQGRRGPGARLASSRTTRSPGSRLLPDDPPRRRDRRGARLVPRAEMALSGPRETFLAVAVVALLAGCGVGEWITTRPIRLRPPEPSGGPAALAGQRSPEELAVLSYNVHGLAWVAAGDDPATRSSAIGWLARRYDVTFFQEDFETTRAIAAQLPGWTIVHGNRMRPDPRLIAAKVVLLPLALALPGFSPPYGSGLTTALAEPLRVAAAGVRRQAYATCDGWFSDRNDCWASKGFLRIRFVTAGGIEVDAYNTHLDSGSSPGSVAARRAQLDDLARAIEEDSRGRPLIVGGDLNLAAARASDRDDLTWFRERLSLLDTGARPELPGWGGYDHLWVRDGHGVHVRVLDAGEDPLFVSRDRALSDHPAIFARIAFEPARSSRADG